MILFSHQHDDRAARHEERKNERMNEKCVRAEKKYFSSSHKNNLTHWPSSSHARKYCYYYKEQFSSLFFLHLRMRHVISFKEIAALHLLYVLMV
jgi:hypothetical protein